MQEAGDAAAAAKEQISIPRYTTAASRHPAPPPSLCSISDQLGRLVSSTDALGNSSSFSYDPMGRITKMTDPNQAQTAFAYDPDGNLLSLTDANGGKTSYTYDPMDRRASRIDPLNHTETYAYDGNGNLVKSTDRRDKVTVYSYNGLNRRTFAGFGQNGGNYNSSISYTWDAGNRMTQASDSIAGTVTRGYDGLDNLIAETTPQASADPGVP